MAESSGVLMHGDIPVADLTYSENRPIRVDTVHQAEHLPIGVHDLSSLLAWLELRNPPFQRTGMSYVLEQINAGSTAEFSGFAHNASLTDCYWFADPREVGKVSWSDISPLSGGAWTKSGQAIFLGRFDYFNDINSPDFATGGVTPKTWVKEHDGIFLLKEDRSSGWAAFAEIAASETAAMLGIDHVPYFFSMTNDKLAIGSPCMIRDLSEELVSFSQLKLDGMDDKAMLRFLKEFALEEAYGKLRVLDFLSDNCSRTYSDLSLLRNAETLEVLRLAPVYDSSGGYKNAAASAPSGSANLTGRSLEDDMRAYAPVLGGRVLEVPRLQEMLLRVGAELGLDVKDVSAVSDAACERAAAYNEVAGTAPELTEEKP